MFLMLTMAILVVDIVQIVVFLMFTMAFYGCLHCRDSRVPYVNHGVL